MSPENERRLRFLAGLGLLSVATWVLASCAPIEAAPPVVVRTDSNHTRWAVLTETMDPGGLINYLATQGYLAPKTNLLACALATVNSDRTRWDPIEGEVIGPDGWKVTASRTTTVKLPQDACPAPIKKCDDNEAKKSGNVVEQWFQRTKGSVLSRLRELRSSITLKDYVTIFLAKTWYILGLAEILRPRRMVTASFISNEYGVLPAAQLLIWDPGAFIWGIIKGPLTFVTFAGDIWDLASRFIGVATQGRNR